MLELVAPLLMALIAAEKEAITQLEKQTVALAVDLIVLVVVVVIVVMWV